MAGEWDVGHDPRLAWRCRRGMLELDQLLEAFLQQGYGRLDAGERALFRQLLDWPDHALLEHLLGLRQARDGEMKGVIDKIRACVAP